MGMIYARLTTDITEEFTKGTELWLRVKDGCRTFIPKQTDQGLFELKVTRTQYDILIMDPKYDALFSTPKFEKRNTPNFKEGGE